MDIKGTLESDTTRLEPCHPASQTRTRQLTHHRRSEPTKAAEKEDLDSGWGQVLFSRQGRARKGLEVLETRKRGGVGFILLLGGQSWTTLKSQSWGTRLTPSSCKDFIQSRVGVVKGSAFLQRQATHRCPNQSGSWTCSPGLDWPEKTGCPDTLEFQINNGKMCNASMSQLSHRAFLCPKPTHCFIVSLFHLTRRSAVLLAKSGLFTQGPHSTYLLPTIPKQGNDYLSLGSHWIQPRQPKGSRLEI